MIVDYGIIGIIVTIIVGTPGILWFISWRKEKEKEKLKSIIIKGIEEFTTYSRLYEFLYNFYSADIEKMQGKYFMANYEYFKEIFGEKIRFSNESNYRFPLIFKQNWVRSNNDKFCMELRPLVDECDIRKYSLISVGKKFLKRFGISDYMSFIRDECKKKVWRQTTFDLFELEEKDNTIIISCLKGNYLYFVQTYELIQKELYYNCICKKRFILRKKLSFDKLEDYSSRPAKIGVSVFTIMKRKDGGYSTFIHERRSEQVEYPRFSHVAPAGTFQPVSEHNIEIQYSFGFTVFREFLEELFDLEEADTKYRESNPIKIFSLYKNRPEMNLPSISPGRLLLGKKPDLSKTKTGKYELVPTGFLIDITSFKPELTFVLYIKDENIHDALFKYIKGCWEADIGEYDLTGNAFDGNFFEYLNKHLNNDKFLPAGAVAVSEGIRWYTKHLIDGE